MDRLGVVAAVIAGLVTAWGCGTSDVTSRASLAAPSDATPSARCTTPRCEAADASMRRGGNALNAGEWQAASAHFLRAAQLVPGDPAPLVDASIALALTDDHEGALLHAQRAAELAPDSLHALVALAEAHLALGHRVEALQVAERAVDQHHTSKEAWFVLGRAYFALVRRSEALDCFDRALGLDPDDLPAQVGALAVLAMLADEEDSGFDAAAMDLRQRAPSDPHVMGNIAAAAEVAGEREQAIRLYREAISTHPDHPIAHYNLGRLLHARSGLDAARPHYLEFLRMAGPAYAFQARQIRELLAP